MTDARVLAARTLGEVFAKSCSLNSVFDVHISQVAERDRGLYQELCFGTLRWYHRLNAITKALLNKPLRNKDQDVHALLLIGLYQMEYLRVPDHAAISETVNASRSLKKPWASGLLNGALRNFQRTRDSLLTKMAMTPEASFSHPLWLIGRLQHAWGSRAAFILHASNQQPPLCLRVNLARGTRDDYLVRLQTAGIPGQPLASSNSAIRLSQAADVTALPGYADGLFSVQDEAAQLAAGLLDLQPGQRVLDACCAPGGKSGHILETQPALAQLVCLDQQAERMNRVKDNLARLQLQGAKLQVGDASTLDWWDGVPFDRVLLDVPCSATGVIRRHPDIKLLRREDDLAKLSALQDAILTTVWQTLKPGGILVYATCSTLPEENSEVVSRFLTHHADASALPFQTELGIEQPVGRQLLPQPGGHDGFYYARLTKAGSTQAG